MIYAKGNEHAPFLRNEWVLNFVFRENIYLLISEVKVSKQNFSGISGTSIRCLKILKASINARFEISCELLIYNQIDFQVIISIKYTSILK